MAKQQEVTGELADRLRPVLAEGGEEKPYYRTGASGLSFQRSVRGRDPGLESGDLGSSLGSDLNWLCDFEQVTSALWASASLFANGAGFAPWSLRCSLALTLFAEEAVFASALRILSWRWLEKHWKREGAGLRALLYSLPSRVTLPSQAGRSGSWALGPALTGKTVAVPHLPLPHSPGGGRTVSPGGVGEGGVRLDEPWVMGLGAMVSETFGWRGSVTLRAFHSPW